MAEGDRCQLVGDVLVITVEATEVPRGRRRDTLLVVALAAEVPHARGILDVYDGKQGGVVVRGVVAGEVPVTVPRTVGEADG